MEPVVMVAQRSSLLLLLLLGLQALTQGDTAGDIRSRSLKPAQVGKRTRNIWQAPRNRKKSTWSYNPGHRSLAFLVAGEVETMTPNPKKTEVTEEFRCLDCCGAVEIPAGVSAAGVNKGGEGTTGNQPPHPVQSRRNEPNPRAPGPDLSSESDTSSEESPGGRRSRWHHRTGSHSEHPQQHPQQHPTHNLCRYLGCRSPLGTYRSSSSEED